MPRRSVGATGSHTTALDRSGTEELIPYRSPCLHGWPASFCPVTSPSRRYRWNYLSHAHRHAQSGVQGQQLGTPPARGEGPYFVLGKDRRGDRVRREHRSMKRLGFKGLIFLQIALMITSLLGPAATLGASPSPSPDPSASSSPAPPSDPAISPA